MPAILWAFLPALSAGSPQMLSGRGFSFVINEPAGWQVDTRSAPQIANFIIHEAGKDWRQADSVVFARLVSRSERESLKDFMAADQQQFEQQCPFGDSGKETWELSSSRPFELKSYDCPGFRQEVVAVTEVPGFFMVFVLSGRKAGALEQAQEPFQEILRTFRWIDSPEGLPAAHSATHPR